eukprot:2156609-Amphidinium_carterae.1
MRGIGPRVYERSKPRTGVRTWYPRSEVQWTRSPVWERRFKLRNGLVRLILGTRKSEITTEKLKLSLGPVEDDDSAFLESLLTHVGNGKRASHMAGAVREARLESKLPVQEIDFEFDIGMGATLPDNYNLPNIQMIHQGQVRSLHDFLKRICEAILKTGCIVEVTSKPHPKRSAQLDELASTRGTEVFLLFNGAEPTEMPDNGWWFRAQDLLEFKDRYLGIVAKESRAKDEAMAAKDEAMAQMQRALTEALARVRHLEGTLEEVTPRNLILRSKPFADCPWVWRKL